ncbi:hypothetical protein GQ457_03G031950 [Hibiscus cannabinus]
MPAADSAPLTNIGRSFLSQVHAMESPNYVSASYELESFQRQVADRFHDLSSVPSEELLSLSWVRKLLDRSVKALDVCNAVRDGIEQIRQWQKLLEIVLCALGDSNVNNNGSESCFRRSLGEGQFRRAKKALIDLSIMILDEKDSGQALAYRNRSFGRNNHSSGHSKDHRHRSLGHFRSLSWSVSRSWSAARQLQAIGNNLTVPRGNEVVATNGVAIPVYTMGCVLLFVMWALVAAIPCQDRGLQVHFYVHRQFPWAAPMLWLHERIMEEWKKRERTDEGDLSSGEESGGIEEGLEPLERQVREVFHRMVRSRTDGLDSFGSGHNPVPVPQ